MVRATGTRGLVVIAAAALLGAIPLAASEARADGPVGNWGHRHFVGRHPHRSAHGRAHGQSAGKLAKVGVSTSAPSVPILPGRTYSWPYAIINRSPALADQVTFTVPLPSALHYVSAQQTCAWQGNAVVCRLGNLKPGQSVVGVITALVDSKLHPGQSVSSPVQVNWCGTKSGSGSASSGSSGSAGVASHAACGNATTAFPSVKVAETADVAVTKAGPIKVRPGQSLPYEMTVTNNGPSVAKNVTLHDTVQTPTHSGQVVLPAGKDGAGCASSGKPMSTVCGLGTLGVGETRTIKIEIRPGTRFQPGLCIPATSQVGSSTPDTNLSNNVASTCTKVTAPFVAKAAVSGPPVRLPNTRLPNTGAPLTQMLDEAAALIGLGLILHRLGRPRRRPTARSL